MTNEQGFVFTASAGNPVPVAIIQATLDDVLRRAGIERRRVHDLRHGFASYLIGHGADPITVRDLCGHKTIAMTADTYGHLIPNRRQEVMQTWDALDDMAC